VTQNGSFKNRKLLWEEIAPAADLRPNTGHGYSAGQRAYSSIPTAEESPARVSKPRLGFARRTTENLEPVQAPEPHPHENQFEEDEEPNYRRRRAWWKPRTNAGRVMLAASLLILLGAFTTSAVMLRIQILRNSRFNLASANNLQMTGASEVSRADLLPVFNQDLGHNVFLVPLSTRRKELEQISWVQHATVMRVLPNQLRVSVVERTPVAFVRSTPEDQQIGLVDADGVLLKMPASLVAQRHYSFPVVTGVDAHDSPAERHKRMVVYTRLIHELDSGSHKLSEQISEIDLRDPNDARVLMPEAGADILAHFGADHFLERYQTYQSHIAEWRQQYPKLATVDLRYEQQVVLRQSDEASAATMPQPAAPEQSASSAQSTQALPKPSAAKHELSASAIPASKIEDSHDVTKVSVQSKEGSSKSNNYAAKPTKDVSKSTHDSQNLKDASLSASSTMQQQSYEGTVVKVALSADKSNSGKPFPKKIAVGDGANKVPSAKSKKATPKSKDRGKNSKRSSSGSKPKKTASKEKPTVKKAAVQTRRPSQATSSQ
jgi:cell division protein FtsQ